MLIQILIPCLILAAAGLILGIGIGAVAKKFAVKQDPKFPQIRDCLPGANCGGCGYAGCDAYAKAILSENAEITLCAVGGEKSAKGIAAVLGLKEVAIEREMAYVQCSADCEKTHTNMRYDGVRSCLEATVLPGTSPKACKFGCVGFGTCVQVCQFNAIHVVNGLARVDESRCVGCGKCVTACPKNVIRLVTTKQRIHVRCSGQDREKKYGCFAMSAVSGADCAFASVSRARSRWRAMCRGLMRTNAHNAESVLKNVRHM